MADRPSASVDEVRSVFFAALRDMPAAHDAWISAQDGGYDPWLLIEPSDIAQERQFYALVAPLYEAFPTTVFMLHVLNPSMFDNLVPDRIVPRSAQHIGAPASA